MEEATAVVKSQPMQVDLSKHVTTMDKLLSAAASGMPVDAIEKFMDLAERQQALEANQAFNKAFAAFKADPPQIVKDIQVKYGNTNYKHASIGAVVSGIIEGLSKHGLSHNWIIDQKENMIKVTCKLTHELGHSEETSMCAGADNSGGKNSIQAIASTVTYLERYTLQAATGIAVLETDDDGNSHKDPEQASQQRQQKPNKKKQEKPTAEYMEDYIDKFLAVDSDTGKMKNTAEGLETGFNKNIKPILSQYTDNEQNGIIARYNDTLSILKEAEKEAA